VERPACGIRPVSGAGRSQIATGGRGALEGQSQRRFDDAQSVNVRSRPALRGDHSCCGPRHCGYASGASRFFPFLTTQNAHSWKQSSRELQHPAVLFKRDKGLDPEHDCLFQSAPSPRLFQAEAATPGGALLARADNRTYGNTKRLAGLQRFRRPLPSTRTIGQRSPPVRERQ
jgi:hypothetical protein